MIHWKDADESEQILLKALSILFEKHQKLLRLILHPDKPRLIASPEEIKMAIQGLSSGEQLLVNIGLDVWDSVGGIHFDDLYHRLDPFNFQRVLIVLLYLYSPGEFVPFKDDLPRGILRLSKKNIP